MADTTVVNSVDPSARGAAPNGGGRGVAAWACRGAVLGVALLSACANFHAVQDQVVYRSAQPDRARLERWIGDYGVRTILYLRGSPPGHPNYEASHGAAVAGGAAFVQVPLTSRRFPTRRELLDLWEALETAEYPLLLHCQGGADRSGLASALHVLRESGDPYVALEQFAFAPYLHTGLRGAWQLPEVLRRYAPWRHRMRFPDWVRLRYDPSGTS